MWAGRADEAIASISAILAEMGEDVAALDADRELLDISMAVDALARARPIVDTVAAGAVQMDGLLVGDPDTVRERLRVRSEERIALGLAWLRSLRGGAPQ